MKAVGIIAEYNPFHNGHAYQLREAKRISGAQYTIAVMSGDFVQRGEPALLDKHTRTRLALQNGVDMVVELPAPFCFCMAEKFAGAGVRLLEASGIVSAIAFGSESGDIRRVSEAAQLIHHEPEHIRTAIKANLSAGMSHASARARALGEDMKDLLCGANDVLGIEYLRALKQIGSSIRPIAIRRAGGPHDAPEACGAFMSATAIRARVLDGNITDTQSVLPQSVYDTLLGETHPRTAAQLSIALLYRLRTMDRAGLAELPDVGEGLENVLYRACREATSYAQLLSLVKSKRYTLARLRRICMSALLGVTKQDIANYDGLFLRVLGVQRQAAVALLPALNASAKLPVITRFSDAEILNAPQQALHEIMLKAAEVSALAGGTAAQFDYSAPLIIV